MTFQKNAERCSRDVQLAGSFSTISPMSEIGLSLLISQAPFRERGPRGSGGLGPVLQTRLMEVSGDAQTLAAALNHSAFNAANALGPFLGGLAIAAGWGWTSTGWVGCALALAGLGVWAVSLLVGDDEPVGVVTCARG